MATIERVSAFGHRRNHCGMRVGLLGRYRLGGGKIGCRSPVGTHDTLSNHNVLFNDPLLLRGSSRNSNGSFSIGFGPANTSDRLDGVCVNSDRVWIGFGWSLRLQEQHRRFFHHRRLCQRASGYDLVGGCVLEFKHGNVCFILWRCNRAWKTVAARRHQSYLSVVVWFADNLLHSYRIRSRIGSRLVLDERFLSVYECDADSSIRLHRLVPNPTTDSSKEGR
mmetsp:Transcript_9767/g.23639  ORF Transcript_9767/g.23639 Transcript_9767/m.23639 type:complete len:222 (-) Transcript_9767:132-797(-)